MATVNLILIFVFSLLGTASFLQVFRCSEVERNALLSFKQGLADPSGRLSLWVGEDCCNWVGVGCNNNTGHVVELDLKNSFPVSEFDFAEENYISFKEYANRHVEVRNAYYNSCLWGKISSSLLDLKHLSYLDLSMNLFNGNVPEFLGSIESLSYLNLSFSFFSGVVPPQLGNLSKLQYLDLNSYSLSSTIQRVIPFAAELEVKSPQWFGGFPSLMYLNLGSVNLDKVPDWVDAVNMLPPLVELHLHFCSLVSLPYSISPINFTLLSVLDLSFNRFNSFIPPWLSNVSGLSTLNLQFNSLRGAIPDGMGHLANLHNLDLSFNNVIGKIPSSFSKLCNLQTLHLQVTNISGEITEFVDGLSQCSNSSLQTLDLSESSVRGSLPDSIGNLSSLQALDVSVNHMNGTIPQSIGKLSMLVSLRLGSNSWEGVLTEAHFENLTRLESLLLTPKFYAKWTLVLNVKQDWVPPFKLRYIGLANVRIGPNFPAWLKTQNELKFLLINNAGISDTIPHGLWKYYPNVTYWSLSDNNLHGQVPYFQFHPSAYYFDLGSNSLKGPLPIFPSNLSVILLEHNMFSGPIPENIGKLLPNVTSLELSSNLITGRIPQSIGMLKELITLSLRNNSLSGKLPPHWKDLQQLKVLDLANNNISGNVPSSMQYLRSLDILLLRQNHLEGELPSFFRNYRNLRSIDLGGNKFFGELPVWIGESFSSLLRLGLRSNLFHGNIPPQLCLLSSLQIIDLAHNDFSGAIPQCLGNWSRDDYSYSGQFDHIQLVSKGREYLYEYSIINLVHSIDLSSNNLSGEIPGNITSLLRLVNVNLSMNHLTGRVPEKIGDLYMLESLDLSMNELSGHIPESLSSLNFLSYLNLSFNNLSGKIPSGNQLQTLNDPSIYKGNSLLCGPPLSTKCSEDETKPRPNGGNRVANENGRDIGSFLFYISMAAGFIVGFWGVCGTLIIKTSWRQAYFRSFDNLKDKIVLFVMVKIVRLLSKVKSEKS
ncbi:receptor-like protein EIX2 isoform X1 [Corylus avellana]|uniref:receptor-like protein EIX2 isoform X1 n=1 Tax=Corylus avellana TaxID=13451 RepID=UPI001E21BC8A|nr:receptor-like protein EIX2 isoform X1 [Corylus avellana]